MSAMNVKRLARVPDRIADDWRIIHLARNWREILEAKITHKPLRTVRLKNGVVLDAPPQVDLNFLFHEIWIDEFYAPHGYEIQPGETVVDIGANIGVFATWAATRQPNTRVVSFEPFPSSAEFFERNRKASGLANIEFHAVAVGASDGKRKLRVEDSWILHSLAADDDRDDGIEIECVGFDTALANIERCDLLKLDCEGGEYEIFYGASGATLSKVGRIVCEYNLEDTENRNGEGLSRFLTEHGFRVDENRVLDHTSGFLCAKRV